MGVIDSTLGFDPNLNVILSISNREESLLLL
jgi:hypothetical protein